MKWFLLEFGFLFTSFGIALVRTGQNDTMREIRASKFRNKLEFATVNAEYYINQWMKQLVKIF